MSKALQLFFIVTAIFVGCKTSRNIHLVEKSPYIDPRTGGVKDDPRAWDIWELLGIIKSAREQEAEELRARQKKRTADLKRKELERLNDVRWGL